MIKLIANDSIKLITKEDCAAYWRMLLEVAERVNNTEDCAEKVAACQDVFGLRFHEVLLAVREIRK